MECSEPVGMILKKQSELENGSLQSYGKMKELRLKVHNPKVLSLCSLFQIPILLTTSLFDIF